MYISVDCYRLHSARVINIKRHMGVRETNITGQLGRYLAQTSSKLHIDYCRLLVEFTCDQRISVASCH